MYPFNPSSPILTLSLSVFVSSSVKSISKFNLLGYQRDLRTTQYRIIKKKIDCLRQPEVEELAKEKKSRGKFENHKSKNNNNPEQKKSISDEMKVMVATRTFEKRK